MEICHTEHLSVKRFAHIKIFKRNRFIGKIKLPGKWNCRKKDLLHIRSSRSNNPVLNFFSVGTKKQAANYHAKGDE